MAERAYRLKLVKYYALSGLIIVSFLVIACDRKGTVQKNVVTKEAKYAIDSRFVEKRLKKQLERILPAEKILKTPFPWPEVQSRLILP